METSLTGKMDLIRGREEGWEVQTDSLRQWETPSGFERGPEEIPWEWSRRRRSSESLPAKETGRVGVTREDDTWDT